MPRVSGWTHWATGAESAAFRIFSRSAIQGKTAELGRGAAVGSLEGGGEMAVAGEPQLEAEGGEIVVLGHQVERAGEPQIELIAVEGHALDLLEDLREIDGGAADLGCDFRERPAARQIAGEEQLRPIHEFLTWDAVGRRAQRLRAQGSTHEGERETFGFERLRDALIQAVSEQRDERLRTRIDR